MSKFWAAASVLLLIGVGLTFLPSGDDINFTDLETECRFDRESTTDMNLEHGKLSFSGHFPVDSPEADLSYTYRVSGDSIDLNIKSSGAEPVTEYFNDCRAIAVYDAETGSIEPGRYMVTVSHDGERAERKVIEVR